jgi:hypothetical protein
LNNFCSHQLLFTWRLLCNYCRLGIDDVSGDTCCLDQSVLGKRGRDESSSSGPKSKACREKIRRDRLNDRFLELSSVINPDKQAKLDKANILSDAARLLAELRGEAEKLKESNEKLRETIKDLKVFCSHNFLPSTPGLECLMPSTVMSCVLK